MSKFNKTKKNSNKTINSEDAVAYKMSDELELYTLVCTTVLSNKFYENQVDTVKRLRNLVKKCSPKFVSKLAVYAREKMYLRSVPLVLVVELAKIHTGDNLISKLTQRVVQRVDEITELLSYYQESNNRTDTKKLGKLSNQIKKGIRNVFESDKFTEYHFSKYNRKTDVRFRDALFLTHPRPSNKEQKKLFSDIANDTLDTACTWETQMSEAGKQDSPATSKKAVWEEMINSKKMGYMATLRNLRNMLQEGVSRECMQKACDYLSNPVAVSNSKQLPFRFLSAYRMLVDSDPCRYGGSMWDKPENAVESPYLTMVLEALEEAIKLSIQNIPMFDNENVLIATDVSGSMQHSVSGRSVISLYDIGTVLAMMMHSKCKTSVAGMFGDDWKVVNFPSTDILRNADEIHRRNGEVGYSTNGYKVLKWACNKKNFKFDRIMMFTDCQLWNSSWSDSDTLQGLWNDYHNRVNPDAKLYLFDLNGYGNTPIEVRDNNVVLISGWSDKVFDILAAIDNGKSAIDEVMSIEI